MSGLRSLEPGDPSQARMDATTCPDNGRALCKQDGEPCQVCGALMNASVEAVPSHRAQAHIALVAAPEIIVREGILDVPGDIVLHHGGRLPGIRIAWRLAGPANAPVVCALGGISANRRVF